ncbi:methylated-DNA-protein-cysteine methyltransferase-like protein [Geomicrobium halophilum]|uniref:Methylated-DNA-protein-cysteine methyltransferase-like protein n=1 Tax=Geomicrobium halophilum TaxID=549000 RepID=A0A841PJY7_9BACL|nr:MGMT family protein [Geomicrobium halophilum]MBB6449177.1 methylated-DNA-protein-cysteine methyltransferase-like protein [Geomicrobium halophilum]
MTNDTSFYENVYKIVRQIPKGSVATYGLIAHWLGSQRASRAVGWALRAAPSGIPAHRVVKKDGTLAHAGVFGGEDFQRGWLEKEGVTFDQEGKVNMEHHVWPGPDDG